MFHCYCIPNCTLTPLPPGIREPAGERQASDPENGDSLVSKDGVVPNLTFVIDNHTSEKRTIQGFFRDLRDLLPTNEFSMFNSVACFGK